MDKNTIELLKNASHIMVMERRFEEVKRILENCPHKLSGQDLLNAYTIAGLPCSPYKGTFDWSTAKLNVEHAQEKKFVEEVVRDIKPCLMTDFDIVNTTDSTVEIQLLSPNTQYLTKKGYRKFEKLQGKYSSKNLSIYVYIDQSGYEYWSLDKEESNYLYVIVALNKGATTYTDSDINHFQDVLCDIARKYMAIQSEHTKKKYQQDTGKKHNHTLGDLVKVLTKLSKKYGKDTYVDINMINGEHYDLSSICVDDSDSSEISVYLEIDDEERHTKGYGVYAQSQDIYL